MEENYIEILNRLKIVLSAKSDADVARGLGISTAALSAFKKQGKFPYERIVKFCLAKGISIEWLLTGDGEMYRHEEKPLMMVCEEHTPYGDFIRVPMVTGTISAGGGLIPDNDIEMTLAFRKDWIQRKGDPRKMSLIRVSGDSMEPTLYGGDIVLVDHNKNYIDHEGGIYAIDIDDMILIKRLQPIYTRETIRIISDNPRYTPIDAVHNEFVVNGKVIWFAREIER